MPTLGTRTLNLVHFDAELENCDEREDTNEYEPSQPEIYTILSKTVGHPAEQPATNEEPQITEKNSSERKS